jgi:hypothetical protein
MLVWVQAWTDDPAHSPFWVKIAAGSLAGTIGSAIANPTDVVMIRMQAPVQAPVVGTAIPGTYLAALKLCFLCRIHGSALQAHSL